VADVTFRLASAHFSAAARAPLPARDGAAVAAAIEFSREVVSNGEGVGAVRRLTRESVVVEFDGFVYRIVGRRESADEGEHGFARRYRGVLVGAGVLNNELLTLTVELREHADGTATAEIVDPRLWVP
jgi:hypothetical protein